MPTRYRHGFKMLIVLYNRSNIRPFVHKFSYIPNAKHESINSHLDMVQRIDAFIVRLEPLLDHMDEWTDWTKCQQTRATTGF